MKYLRHDVFDFCCGIGGLVLMMLSPGCGEKDVPFIVDEEEIQRCIAESLEGKELFRTDNFFNDDAYSIPGDAAIYKDVVDSVRRSYYYQTFTPKETKKHYWALSIDLRDAEVEVTDRFFGTRLRILDSDTSSEAFVRDVTRIALVLKLGSDIKPFAGWKIFGFNGGMPGFPTSIAVKDIDEMPLPVDLGSFVRFSYEVRDARTGDSLNTSRSDSSYLRVDALPDVNPLERLIVSSEGVTNRSVYQLLRGYLEGGFVTRTMPRPTPDRYLDTITTHPGPPYLWNFLVIHEVNTNLTGTGFTSRFWTIPYRVP